jgi:hypothetical protein
MSATIIPFGKPYEPAEPKRQAEGKMDLKDMERRLLGPRRGISRSADNDGPEAA